MNRSVEALLSLRCREVPVLKLGKRKPVSRNLRYTFLVVSFFASLSVVSFFLLMIYLSLGYLVACIIIDVSCMNDSCKYVKQIRIATS